MIGLVFIAVLPLLRGTEQAGRTQTSADAAALAGAGSVRTYALDHLGSVVVASGGMTFGELLGAARGAGDAQTFASRNGATLVEYRYDPWTDEAYARTELDEEVEPGMRAESEATASLGVALAHCGFEALSVVVGYEPVPTPTPEPVPAPGATSSPTPTPTPTPPPVPIYGHEYRFRCPGFDTGATTDLTSVLDDARSWLDSALEPTLVR